MEVGPSGALINKFSYHELDKAVMHVYEVRPRKEHRGVDPMRSHSVGCGMTGRMQSAMQSVTPNIAAAHRML
jgi:hypothetical protein